MCFSTGFVCPLMKGQGPPGRHTSKTNAIRLRTPPEASKLRAAHTHRRSPETTSGNVCEKKSVDIWLVCSVVHAALESCAEELNRPLPASSTYMSCRAVAGAVLYARANGVSLDDLCRKIINFRHSMPNQHLQELNVKQRRSVAAFASVIYEIDAFFDHRPDLPHLGSAKSYFSWGYSIKEVFSAFGESMLLELPNQIKNSTISRDISENSIGLIACVVLYLRINMVFF